MPERPYKHPVKNKFIRIEYEVPPTRAVHWMDYFDDGQSDEAIEEWIAEEHPLWRVRTITRCVEVP